MGENSAIEWTDHTFNPWMGCTKVSPGCTNCYAETLMDERYNRVKWGPQGKRIRTSQTYWRAPFIWDRRAAIEGIRYRVFCGSLCDVFEVKDDQPELSFWRAHLLATIVNTPNLDWLLLTKRPEYVMTLWEMPLPDNIWIGTSVENQKYADRRIPDLLEIPAKVRFLSCEPLLGPIDNLYLADIDWVIVGGESGPDRRKMNLAWARDIRDQCQAAGVPFFFKQVDKVQTIPADLLIREFPHKMVSCESR